MSADDAFKRLVNQLRSATAILAECVVGAYYDLYTEKAKFLKL